MTASEKALVMFQTYGDQSYHKSMELAVIAFWCGDLDAHTLYREAAEVLAKRGYAWVPKREIEEE